MQRIGARELKQHTGALIERIKRGERLLLTHRGSPIAIITPINSAAFERLLEREAEYAESLAWLKASESASDSGTTLRIRFGTKWIRSPSARSWEALSWCPFRY
jgi:prevent-host-death family protein